MWRYMICQGMQVSMHASCTSHVSVHDYKHYMLSKNAYKHYMLTTYCTIGAKKKKQSPAAAQTCDSTLVLDSTSE